MYFKREERVKVVVEQEDPAEKEVCRDFQNGRCTRGSRCVYEHPLVDICRDFQNGRCTRQNCRFTHISRREEESYVNTGSLPAHVSNNQSINSNGMSGTQVAGIDFKGILGKRKIVDFLASLPTYGQENKTLTDLCRDFEKGTCSRGVKCRYYHPKLMICRDFQKDKCEREKCRFLHMTCEEEDVYNGSGVVPDHIDKDEVRRKRVMNESSGVGGAAGMNGMAQNELLCHDFEKGKCSRGVRCKYYHPMLIICRDFQKDKCEREKCRFLHMTCEEEDTYESSGIVPDHIDKDDVRKKRVMAPSNDGRIGNVHGTQQNNYQSPIPNVSFQAVWQENMALKLKVTEMQGQVNDLRKVNDTLYEQNSNYRKIRKISYC